MERNLTKIKFNQKNASFINSSLAFEIIGLCVSIGISEFCVCPGGRNTSFVDCLEHYANDNIKTYFFYEERSAAFFALGRSKKTGRPIAVITTSGTAVGELLPAVMESFYSENPLLLITADRPKRFKGSGAPQTAEQEGIFGVYANYSQNIEYGDCINLKEWDQKKSAHLNVCLEESYEHTFNEILPLELSSNDNNQYVSEEISISNLINFLKLSKNPIAIVSTLLEKDRMSVVEFLEKLNIPVYCEGVSGIRENERLDSIRIKCPNKISINEIDGIIRIGGVPTLRLWRDLEHQKINVISISHLPFSGLSWGGVEHVNISQYLDDYVLYFELEGLTPLKKSKLIIDDHRYWSQIEMLLNKNRESEQAFFYQISKFIPSKSQIFLGNSLSIRQWDQYATYQNRDFKVFASRGLNGIDGQISTFLGLCDPNVSNWAILGDLTSLYDLAGPWIMDQLEAKNIHIVIVNNGGGRIFSNLFKNRQVQNNHSITFEYFAKLWNLNYVRWSNVVGVLSDYNIVEYTTNNSATNHFELELKGL